MSAAPPPHTGPGIEPRTCKDAQHLGCIPVQLSEAQLGLGGVDRRRGSRRNGDSHAEGLSGRGRVRQPAVRGAQRAPSIPHRAMLCRAVLWSAVPRKHAARLLCLFPKSSAPMKAVIAWRDPPYGHPRATGGCAPEPPAPSQPDTEPLSPPTYSRQPPNPPDAQVGRRVPGLHQELVRIYYEPWPIIHRLPGPHPELAVGPAGAEVLPQPLLPGLQGGAARKQVKESR